MSLPSLGPPGARQTLYERRLALGRVPRSRRDSQLSPDPSLSNRDGVQARLPPLFLHGRHGASRAQSTMSRGGHRRAQSPPMQHKLSANSNLPGIYDVGSTSSPPPSFFVPKSPMVVSSPRTPAFSYDPSSWEESHPQLRHTLHRRSLSHNLDGSALNVSANVRTSTKSLKRLDAATVDDDESEIDLPFPLFPDTSTLSSPTRSKFGGDSDFDDPVGFVFQPTPPLSTPRSHRSASLLSNHLIGMGSNAHRSRGRTSSTALVHSVDQPSTPRTAPLQPLRHASSMSSLRRARYKTGEWWRRIVTSSAAPVSRLKRQASWKEFLRMRSHNAEENKHSFPIREREAHGARNCSLCPCKTLDDDGDSIEELADEDQIKDDSFGSYDSSMPPMLSGGRTASVHSASRSSVRLAKRDSQEKLTSGSAFAGVETSMQATLPDGAPPGGATSRQNRFSRDHVWRRPRNTSRGARVIAALLRPNSRDGSTITWSSAGSNTAVPAWKLPAQRSEMLKNFDSSEQSKKHAPVEASVMTAVHDGGYQKHKENTGKLEFHLSLLDHAGDHSPALLSASSDALEDASISERWSRAATFGSSADSCDNSTDRERLSASCGPHTDTNAMRANVAAEEFAPSPSTLATPTTNLSRPESHADVAAVQPQISVIPHNHVGPKIDVSIVDYHVGSISRAQEVLEEVGTTCKGLSLSPVRSTLNQSKTLLAHSLDSRPSCNDLSSGTELRSARHSSVADSFTTACAKSPSLSGRSRSQDSFDDAEDHQSGGRYGGDTRQGLNALNFLAEAYLPLGPSITNDIMEERADPEFTEGFRNYRLSRAAATQEGQPASQNERVASTAWSLDIGQVAAVYATGLPDDRGAVPAETSLSASAPSPGPESQSVSPSEMRTKRCRQHVSSSLPPPARPLPAVPVGASPSASLQHVHSCERSGH